MDQQKIKEQVIRMEGIADGIRNGGVIFAQWLVSELSKEQPAGAKVNQGGTPTEFKPEVG